MTAVVLALDLMYADGVVETVIRRDAEVTLGRGPDASLRIERVAELAPMQLLIAGRRNGVWVSDAPGAPVAATLGGAPVGHALIPWGSEIDIGSLTVRIRRARSETSRSRPHPLLLFAGALALVSMAVMYSRSDAGSALPSTDTPPPALIASAPSGCPPASRGPLAHAAELAREADARESRYPFAPADGPVAVTLYRAAAACLRRGGAPQLEASLLRRADDLGRRLESEYRSLLVQQQRALQRRDLPVVLATTRALRALLAHHTGPYLTWLDALERHVTTRMSHAAPSSNH